MESHWFQRSMEHVRNISATGKPPMRGYGMIRSHPSLDDIVVVPAQVASFPVDSLRMLVDTQVVIGAGKERPLVMEQPFFIAPLSLGALTEEARLLLTALARNHGIAFDTGEGGLTKEEKDSLKHGGMVISQVASGRYGVDLGFLTNADAVEISLGHGAKPGLGGIVFNEKIGADIAEIRKIPEGADALSPARHLDIDPPEDVGNLVTVISEATDGEIPILLKFAAGNIIDDVKVALESGVDAIVIDSSEAVGATVPHLVGNEAGTPLLGIFGGFKRALRMAGRSPDEVKLLVNGGAMTASDVYKCLAMGATAVGLDLPLLVAMGCLGCVDRCTRGDCPTGVAGSTARFPNDIAERGLNNYMRTLEQELRMFIGLSGHHSVSEVSSDDVRAMTYDAASVTGVKLMGYERTLPVWQH